VHLSALSAAEDEPLSGFIFAECGILPDRYRNPEIDQIKGGIALKKIVAFAVVLLMLFPLSIAAYADLGDSDFKDWSVVTGPAGFSFVDVPEIDQEGEDMHDYLEPGVKLWVHSFDSETKKYLLVLDYESNILSDAADGMELTILKAKEISSWTDAPLSLGGADWIVRKESVSEESDDGEGGTTTVTWQVLKLVKPKRGLWVIIK